MRENIPVELRALPQWVAAGPDKRPIDPRNGRPASVTSSETWGTFEAACAAGLPHVGFVLTEADPFTIIDLDDKADRPATPEQKQRHTKIIEAFDSYTERSASGRGVHIIVRGRLLAGVHKDYVEAYSDRRFMICTGDVLRNAPVRERQDLLDVLFTETRSAATSDLAEEEEVMSDRDLVDRATRAGNGAKFNDLCNGKWQELGYPSQSEADFALLSLLAFYTRSNEQVRRLFRYSRLGQREKATRNDSYLDRCLGKLRASEPPPIAATALAEQAARVLGTHAEPERGLPLPWPPGLVGDLARYFHASAVRPVPEVALTAALGLVAGISGRQWNICGEAAGLNLYVILLGETGVGKEGGKDGTSRTLHAVRKTVPAVSDFIGPTKFASGQALVRRLSSQPCLFSVQSEFGHTLKTITAPRATAADQALRQALLDLGLIRLSGHQPSGVHSGDHGGRVEAEAEA